eukprot:CAMPEP_0182457958 /NCGR_PEP_ID=MMETSP1319-20130603/3403_1 /TAXON_ID=172717 /ORGANISM="Bolidomonas pacifica, Strain RCC208" /LENGTH=234 /DNA_ID=CAMNT_0024656533 /DNA_START=180 /DNA_END=880 /DNA_ORIENTATION=-
MGSGASTSPSFPPPSGSRLKASVRARRFNPSISRAAEAVLNRGRRGQGSRPTFEIVDSPASFTETVDEESVPSAPSTASISSAVSDFSSAPSSGRASAMVSQYFNRVGRNNARVVVVDRTGGAMATEGGRRLPPARPSSGSSWRKVKMEEGMDESVDLTPRDDASALLYRYYCPLCMCYFANTTQQPCCGNYTCYGCAVSYLQSKGIIATTDDTLPRTVPRWLDCCHCTQSLQS